MIEAEAPPTKMLCIECGSKDGVFRCLDCSANPLLCRSCCRLSHKRLHMHRIQCWNGKYFRTSALWETGLVFNLGHGGNPCPSLAHIEADENKRQDVEWEDTLNRPPAGGAQNANTCSSGGMSPASTPADLDVRMHAAADDIFGDNDEVRNDELEQDEGYDSDPADGLVDPEEPDNDIRNDHDNDRDDNFTGKYYERMKGIATPPHPDPEDPLGNPFVTFVETNGVHHLPIHYCICGSARPHDEQLLTVKLFPSTFSMIKTVFTFNVLDDFRMSNLSCKSSCYQYFLKLRRLTSPVFPKSVPNRYHELLRVSRQWRNLELRKGFGFGHQETPPQAGQMSHGCASCPQPGINLPDNWKEDPHQ